MIPMHTRYSAKQKLVWGMTLTAPAIVGVFSTWIISSLAPVCAKGFKDLFNGKPLPALTSQVLAAVTESRISSVWVANLFGLAVLFSGYLLVRHSSSGEEATRRVLLLTTCAWIVCALELLICMVAFSLPMITLCGPLQGG